MRIRWSGQAAPTCESAAESFPHTNSITGSDVSVSRILAFCVDTAPRRAGKTATRRSCCSSVDGGVIACPPKGARPSLCSATNSAALLMAVIVRS